MAPAPGLPFPAPGVPSPAPWVPSAVQGSSTPAPPAPGEPVSGQSPVVGLWRGLLGLVRPLNLKAGIVLIYRTAQVHTQSLGQCSACHLGCGQPLQPPPTWLGGRNPRPPPSPAQYQGMNTNTKQGTNKNSPTSYSPGVRSLQ